AGPHHARAGVQAVEGRVREDLPGGLGEAGVAGADVEPALRLPEPLHHPGRRQMAPPTRAGREDALREALQAVPGEVLLVEGQALGGEPGVLEGVGAVEALVDDERARPAPYEVRGAQPGTQPPGAAPWAVLAARFVEVLGERGELGRVHGTGGGRERHGRT